MGRRFPTPLIPLFESQDQYLLGLQCAAAHSPLHKSAESPSREHKGHSLGDRFTLDPGTQRSLSHDEFVDACHSYFRKENGEKYSSSYARRIANILVLLGIVDYDQNQDVVCPAPTATLWQRVAVTPSKSNTVDFETFLWRSIKRKWVLHAKFPEGIEGLQDILRLVHNADNPVSARALKTKLAEKHGYEFNEQGIRGFPELLVLLGALEETADGTYDTTGEYSTFRDRFRTVNLFQQFESTLKKEGANTEQIPDHVKRDLMKYYMYRESGGRGKEQTWYTTFWKDYVRSTTQKGDDPRAALRVAKKYIEHENRRDEYRTAITNRFESFESTDLRNLSTDVLNRIASAESEAQAHQIRATAGSGLSRSDLAGLVDGRPAYTFPDSFELHNWQSEAADRWCTTGDGESERGIAKVVTGAGKTVMALEVVRRWLDRADDGVVTIVVPTRVLLYQWLTELVSKLNIPIEQVGWAGDGHKDSFTRMHNGDPENIRVLVSIVNTAVKDDYLGSCLADRNPTDHLLIADECHRYTGDTFSNIFNYPNTATLGLSATPVSQSSDELPEDEQRLIDEIGDIYYELTYDEGISRGLIPKFKVNYIGFDLTDEEQFVYERLSKKVSNAVKEIEARFGDRLYQMPGNYAQKLQTLRNQTDSPTPEIRDYFTYTQERRELVDRAVGRQGITHHLLQEEVLDREKKAIVFQERIKQLEEMVAPFDRRDINQKTGDIAKNVSEDARANLYQQYEDLKEIDKNIEALFADTDFRPVMYHSGHSRGVWNDFAMEWFRDKGFANVMLSVRALIEGVDVPSADIGIVRVSSSSVRQRIQTLGRILRTGKDAADTSELYVLYARETVDERIFAEYDWDQQLENAEVNHYLWESDSKSVAGEKRLAAPDELPDPTRFEGPKIPDPKELEFGDGYEGPRRGKRLKVDAEGDLYLPGGNSQPRRPIHGPEEVLEAARFVYDNKRGGRLTINEANHIITMLEDGPVFLGVLDDDLDVGESTGNNSLTEDAPTSLSDL